MNTNYRKMYCTTISLAFLLSVGLSLSSCEEDHFIDMGFTTEQITSNGGAGDFKVINMATNDTLVISGGITIGKTEKLTAKNGNILKIMFEPAEEYKGKYVFNTTFTLHDGTKIENQQEYKYAIKDTEPGQYRVSVFASYEQHDDKNSIDITSGGSFYLEVTE